MEFFTLIIAIIALVLAIVAFRRTGGIGDLRHRLDTLSATTGTARDRTADALDRLERLIRGKEKPPETEKTPGEPPRPEDRR